MWRATVKANFKQNRKSNNITNKRPFWQRTRNSTHKSRERKVRLYCTLTVQTLYIPATLQYSTVLLYCTGFHMQFAAAHCTFTVPVVLETFFKTGRKSTHVFYSEQRSCDTPKLIASWLASMSGNQSEASGYSGYSAAIKRPLHNRR